jgi:pimeloyl-ACP methyl ester carboxylesterase
MKEFFLAFIYFPVIILLSFHVNAQTDSGRYYSSFDNTRIYYEVKGNGYPVILIHGFMNTADNMKRNAVYQQLLNAGYKVVVPDMRGNGRSDKPHSDEAYADDAEAKDIMGLATELNLNNYNVLGYSRGSIIAARLLVLDKRINKAVMGGMGADFTNPDWPRRIMFYRALSGDTVKELEPMVKHVKDAGLDQHALMLQQKYQPSTPKEALSKVKQPVLVISGAEDSDNGSPTELVKLFPHAQYVQVPGDHGGAQKTKEFADAVLKFFKE